MQITNSAGSDTSKGRLYKQIKPPLVAEHAFPLTRFVCKSAHVTVCITFTLNIMIVFLSDYIIQT